jgi:prepilin-type N-terminal cleavage/methylation domain-containing protein
MAAARVTERRPRGEAGFTLIEVLVAVMLSLIGLAGVLGLQRASSRATGYSRHATEAAILGEDKLERLRTVPTADLAGGSEHVDAQGVAGAGPYTRTWTVTWTGDIADLSVVVSWFEGGTEPHGITYRTRRNR